MQKIYLSFLMMIALSVCCAVKLNAQTDARMAAYEAKRKFINESVLNKPFQEFKIKSGKERITNESLKGKVVFLNFWFENCPPCRAEFRSLNWLYKEYKDNPNFAFLAVTFENTVAMKRVKQEFNLTFPMYYLPDVSCSKLIYESGYPTNIILDKEGVVRYFFSGGARNEGTAFKDISSRIKPLFDKYLQ